MKKGKSTLILLGVFVVLFAAIYFFEIKGGEKREKRDKIANQFFKADKDSVTQVEFTTASDVINCQKKGAEWFITAPIITAGDGQAIESDLSSILSAAIDRKIADSTSDLGLYGLAAPRGQVRVDYSNGGLTTLLIGDENPAGDMIFVKLQEDESIYTTQKSLWSNVNKKLYDLRDKKIMHFDVDEVRKISIDSRKKGKVTLEKVGGVWKIVAPVELEANENEVKSVLNRLATGRAKNFINEQPSDLKKYGLTKPDIAINLEIGQSLARTGFVIGDTARNDGGGFYAREETRLPVFTIENWAVDGLRKGAFDLQNKKLTGFDGQHADRIVWRIANQEYAAIRVDSLNWMVVAPETLQVDATLMSRWLKSLGDVSADELESYQPKPLANYGLAMPYLRLSVFNRNNELGTILVGKEVGDKYYAKTTKYPVVYRIKKNTFDRLYKLPEDLVKKAPPAPAD